MEKHNNRRFYSLNDFFKDEFKDKIFKVSLDGGFTCPNRDGKVAHGGCIFCSDAGSGEFAGNRRKSITEQIDEQLEF
ncbi:MAG: TIGR01212 family radical SAM protein, partial [Cetobacterium sp.]